MSRPCVNVHAPVVHWPFGNPEPLVSMQQWLFVPASISQYAGEPVDGLQTMSE